jgi:hypothetical protein
VADLSPAAQAVRDAFFNGPDDFTASIAAALRAAADQLGCDKNQSSQVRGILAARRQLLTLANELDPTP